MVTRYQITQALWEEVMDTNPSMHKGVSRPVERVSWHDAVEFCNRLSLLEGRKPVYEKIEVEPTYQYMDEWYIWHHEYTQIEGADGYRLLTEAEWEYCARSGENHKYSGSDKVGSVGWCNGNSDKKPKPSVEETEWLWTLHMSGVWEWCWDLADVEVDEDHYEWWFDTQSYYPRTKRTDPKGPDCGLFCIIRGGSIYEGPNSLRVSTRHANSPYGSSSNLGFRIGRNI